MSMSFKILTNIVQICPLLTSYASSTFLKLVHNFMQEGSAFTIQGISLPSIRFLLRFRTSVSKQNSSNPTIWLLLRLLLMSSLFKSYFLVTLNGQRWSCCSAGSKLSPRWSCSTVSVFWRWNDDWRKIGLWCLSLLSKMLVNQNYPAQVEETKWITSEKWQTILPKMY
jgi:hypothetical protein